MRQCQFRMRDDGTMESPEDLPCELPAVMLFDYGDIQRWMCEPHYDCLMEWARGVADQDWAVYPRQLVKLNR